MKKFARWLEWLATGVVALMALAAACQIFLADPQQTGRGIFSQLQERATMLANETDPIKRDSVCIPLSAFGRSLDAQIPTNASVFLAGMLGKENSGTVSYTHLTLPT